MGNVVHTRRAAAGSAFSSCCALALVAWALAGCGASARKDVDLNTGEVQDDARQQELTDLFSPPPEGWVYHVNEGDQLEVVFFTHPEENRFVQVRPDGRITLPYVGDVEAAGRTPTDLAADIQTRYETVLIKPRVDIIVQKFAAPIYVLGEVNRPGQLVYDQQIDLVRALASAGGFNDEARLSNVVVLRQAPDGKGAAAILNFRSYMAHPDGPGNIELRPYDVVWVPKDSITRWDDNVTKLFRGTLDAEDVVLKGWSLTRFNQVYNRGNVRP